MSLFDMQLLEQFKQQVNEHSIQHAAHYFLQEIGITLEVSGTIPADGATLLIPNHPSGMDGMLLFAAVNRLDFYQVGLAMHRLMNQTFLEKILPVYRLKKKADFLPNIFMSNLQSHVLDNKADIETKNRQAIHEAALLVSDAHAVAIFPEGVAGKSPEHGTWKAGIGFLAKDILNPETQVVFVKIEGLQGIDLFRPLHPLLRQLIFSEIKVTITFAEPILLAEMIDREADAKAITNALARSYTTVFSE